LGAAAILKRLALIDAEVARRLGSGDPRNQDTPDGLAQFSNDALVEALLTRENVTQVTVVYGSRGFHTNVESLEEDSVMLKDILNKFLGPIGKLIFTTLLGPVDNYKTLIGMVLWAVNFYAASKGISPVEGSDWMRDLLSFLGNEFFSVAAPSLTFAGLAHKAAKHEAK
jgi:hypothetical protein